MTRPAAASAFLSSLGPKDRQAWRLPVWLLLSAGLAVLLTIPTMLLFGVVAPDVAARLADGARFTGEGRLLDEARLTAIVAGSLAALGFATLFAARIVYGRPVRSFLAPAHPFRLKDFGLGFLVYGGLLAVFLGGAVLITGEAPPMPAFDPAEPLDERLIYVGAAAVFLLLAALAEEIMFRGVLLQQTGAFVANAVALCALNGLLFALIHADFAPGPFVARFVMGATWAWAVLRLGGVEFSLGAHLANNLVVVMFLGTLSEEMERLTAGSPVEATSGALNLLVAGLALVVVELLARARARRGGG